MADNEFVEGLLYIVLAILWIWLFLQNKRKQTVKFTHIVLLVSALGILINSLYKAINSSWF